MKLEKVADNLFRNPLTGIHYVRIRRKGKQPLFESLDTKNRRIAFDARDQKVREYLGFNQKKIQNRLIKDEHTDFMNAYIVTVKPTTYRRTENSFDHHIIPYWGLKCLDEVTPQSWQEYLSEEIKKSLNPKTGISRELSNDWKAMSMLLSFAVKNKRLIAKPELFNPKRVSDISKEYSDEEIEALMAAASDDLRLIIYMAVKVGPRDTEILNLKWSDIDFKQKTIRFGGGKGGEKTGVRRSIAPDSLLAILKARKEQSRSEFVIHQKRDPSKTVAPSARDINWARTRLRAGVTGRFHDLRHTAITRMLRAKMPINWVSKQVGSSVRTISKVYDKMQIHEVPQIADAVTLQNEAKFFERNP
jgi:integrase